MAKNWAISVEAEIANTEITLASSQGIVTHRDRNNIPKSVQHLTEMNMYAELARKNKCKKRGIKSLRDNKLNQNVKVGKVYFMGALGSSNNRMHALLSALSA